MKHYHTSKILLVVMITILNISCYQQTKPGTATRVIEQNSGDEIKYQEAIEKLENYKSNILKNEDIYNLSMQKKGSLLDKREAIDSKKEIVRYSNLLLELANNSLNNEKMITSVTGGRNTMLEYKKVAQQKLAKYE
jgi:hypothetical protein